MSAQMTVDGPTLEQALVAALPADSRTLVIAPAGTGKTYTLVRRLDHLLDQELSADKVLMLSFSRAAVRELTARTAASTGRSRFVTARTFDAWALDLLNQTYADQDWHQLPFDERIREATGAILDGHANAYIGSLRHVLLDEVQDLVGDRRELVKALLTSVNCGFTMMGDPAQAIYGFQVRSRGSEPDIFSWVRDTYGAGLIKLALTRDFRARTPRSPGLLACGEALRVPTAAYGADIPRRIREEFLGVSTAGRLDDVLGGFMYLEGSCAILCRDNGQALEVSALLHQAGIEHRLQRRAGDDVSPRWLANLFRRHDGLTADLAAFAQHTGLTGESLAAAWEALLPASRTGADRIDLSRLRSALARGRLARLAIQSPSDAVTVSSMHRAKGLEYDRVFVIEHRRREDDDPMEEARLLYMAMTRCRDDMFRLEQLPQYGAVYIRRDTSSGRWCRYHFRNRSQRHGMALESGDVSKDFPAGMVAFSADPVKLQEYLATKVRPGDPVTLTRSAELAEDDLSIPLYIVEHDGQPIGVVSPLFRKALARYMYGRKQLDAHLRWPDSITNCWIDDVEAVAGSTAAGRRAGFGEHGVWLAPRLSGLSWFRYAKAESDDE
ncbi:UvrD-helicase domain-containing protein [Micromonospora sp. 4G55]|uniref:UvrD-helicase domain-containing protein n=1 Tax=Micromonospora sp. 4G55 TaxID=2806102 RepID=UPI001A58CD92|nr:UvrD-helicase domain-containing protein [Micromonospora sp. 4G55]MBM0255498.1 ATP-dependent helicase [Micromonospora sp. 4G55]